jgi:hypothetical protein
MTAKQASTGVAMATIGSAKMPRGPRGEKRLADVIGNTVLIAKIATGQVEDVKRERNPHAAALGKLGGAKGGKARAKAMTKAQRSESAKHAARARWGDSRREKRGKRG